VQVVLVSVAMDDDGVAVVGVVVAVCSLLMRWSSRVEPSTVREVLVAVNFCCR
jgi:hypothetical protein